ncbi:unannotated protein [freshwater metagenome]|uniref:Unannotated protein n=1 Tax=freshwater metagenome TaxID=449393 RepID=A0A6J6FIS6_9ZZZZ
MEVFSSSTPKCFNSPSSTSHRSTTACHLRASLCSSEDKISSTALSNPAISSLPTLAGRPMLCSGPLFTRQALINSFLPTIRPLDPGPFNPFPPLKIARSAPLSRVKYQRFDTGGIWSAASTIKGIPSKRARFRKRSKKSSSFSTWG